MEHKGPVKRLPGRAAEFPGQLRGECSLELKDAYIDLERRRQWNNVGTFEDQDFMTTHKAFYILRAPFYFWCTLQLDLRSLIRSASSTCCSSLQGVATSGKSLFLVSITYFS